MFVYLFCLFLITSFSCYLDWRFFIHRFNYHSLRFGMLRFVMLRITLFILFCYVSLSRPPFLFFFSLCLTLSLPFSLPLSLSLILSLSHSLSLSLSRYLFLSHTHTHLYIIPLSESKVPWITLVTMGYSYGQQNENRYPTHYCKTYKFKQSLSTVQAYKS